MFPSDTASPVPEPQTFPIVRALIQHKNVRNGACRMLYGMIANG